MSFFAVSPTNSTAVIVPAALLAIFVVLGFIAIFVLLFIAFYLYNGKHDLREEKKRQISELEETMKEKVRQISELKESMEQEKEWQISELKETMEQEKKWQISELQETMREKERQINKLQSLKESLQSQNQSLQRQISVSSDTTDGDAVTLCFARIAMDIKNHCPTQEFYLKIIGKIMGELSDCKCCSDKRFQDLVRDVRDRAHKLKDDYFDEEKVIQKPDCGDGNVHTDSVPDLEDAKAKFRHYLDMLDAIVN